MHVDLDRAHLAAVRVVADFAAQRMRQQLVAVTDAEYRRARVRGVAQPRRAAFAPVVAVGDHRAGTGDDDPGKSVTRRQRGTALDIDDHRFLAMQAGGAADPVREAAVAAHRGDRLAGFEDQE